MCALLTFSRKPARLQAKLNVPPPFLSGFLPCFTPCANPLHAYTTCVRVIPHITQAQTGLEYSYIHYEEILQKKSLEHQHESTISQTESIRD